MKQLRKCTSSELNTGTSKCPIDFDKIKGAILVEPGHKLPADLTADILEKMAHADLPERIYGIVPFSEYAKEGGDTNIATNGYGSQKNAGLNARTDTFTLDNYQAELASSLTKCKNKKWDVYFFDKKNILYGVDDGTDTLAGFPMSNVYTNATPHPTSSTNSEMTVSFCYEDAEDVLIRFDYIELPFSPLKLTLGLTPVKLSKTTDGNSEYKLYEVKGAYDVTPIFGPLIAEAGNAVITGTTSAVTYNEASATLTITGGDKVGLKSPSVLYQNEIKGIILVES